MYIQLKVYCAQSLSCVQLFVTPQTVAHQALLSIGFPRQECWSELPFPPPGDLPYSGLEPGFLPCRQSLYSLMGFRGGSDGKAET